MATPQEIRLIRLKNDHSEMVNLRGNIIQWKPIKGDPPYIEAYELTVKVKTIINSMPSYRDEHIISLELSEAYPNSPPLINMKTTPPPYHPNWYSNGNWCYGSWDVSESLGNHVIRMIRTLQFDLDITNPESAANSDAKDWFVRKKTSNLFPCDSTNLPDPTKSKFTVQAKIKKKFQIE